MLLMITFWVYVLNLAICEPGQRVTEQFDQLHEELNRCEWNELSIEMRRMYLIILSDTQQSVNIKSYAGIACTRDTLKKSFYEICRQCTQYGIHLFPITTVKIPHFQIINKAFSYFMTLRKFRHF